MATAVICDKIMRNPFKQWTVGSEWTMPLLVEDKVVEERLTSVQAFLAKFPELKQASRCLIKEKVRVVGPEKLLYVGQREIGGTTSDDEVITVLGSEDATTCHIGVLRHSGSGATCLAHFDGCGTRGGMDCMIRQVQNMSTNKPSGRLEFHIVGGFDDDRKLSHKLSMDLLNILMTRKENIHLKTACITEMNTEDKDGVPFPIFYGLGVKVKTGEIFKGTFPDKGPDQALRGARHFTGGKEMIDIYDPATHQLVLRPFSYESMSDIDMWVGFPDHVIRQKLSTSPDQEPPNFEDNVRASLRQIRDHPNPGVTMFPGGKPRRYQKLASGAWVKL